MMLGKLGMLEGPLPVATPGDALGGKLLRSRDDARAVSAVQVILSLLAGIARRINFQRKHLRRNLGWAASQKHL